jgi:hypothetical protein
MVVPVLGRFRTIIRRPGGGGGSGSGSRRPMSVERDGRVPLFEDVVETTRLSKERVRLRTCL